jgi:hypothetical protein
MTRRHKVDLHAYLNMPVSQVDVTLASALEEILEAAWEWYRTVPPTSVDLRDVRLSQTKRKSQRAALKLFQKCKKLEVEQGRVSCRLCRLTRQGEVKT